MHYGFWGPWTLTFLGLFFHWKKLHIIFYDIVGIKMSMIRSRLESLFYIHYHCIHFFLLTLKYIRTETFLKSPKTVLGPGYCAFCWRSWPWCKPALPLLESSSLEHHSFSSWASPVHHLRLHPSFLLSLSCGYHSILIVYLPICLPGSIISPSSSRNTCLPRAKHIIVHLINRFMWLGKMCHGRGNSMD